MSPMTDTHLAETRHLALCYVRQSYTRDEADRNSADRQQANALALCAQRGWTPLLFVEADGHRSASGEENRPEWLRLKDWLTYPQVVAVVANDPSRLYRKMWRMGSFLETLDSVQVQLLFASPGSPVRDLSNPADRFILQMYALMDESYVHDLARRQKDSIAFRRKEGKTTGIPPFGVVRNAQGYLMPSPLGAWLLPDGRALAGYRQDEPPTPSSEWRGYYDCTYRILSLYVSSDTGREKLAQRLNDEGWRFKDRWNQPRLLQEDDIRRVICNWAEYGGIVRDRRAKDVPLYNLDGTASRFVPERAVFPIELLRQVLTIAHARSFRQGNHGKALQHERLPLAGLCYCAHCEAAAKLQPGRHYRPRLGTVRLSKQTCYRHRSNVKCSTSSHSIPATELEHEVGRLIDVLVMSRHSPLVVPAGLKYCTSVERNGA